MTLILSGTDGLSDVDGSAATPAIRGTDANTGIFFPAADTVGVSTGGSERMRVDSSGNVGIGTAGGTYGLALNRSSNNGSTIQINNSTLNASFLLQVDTAGTAYVQQQYAGALAFATSNSEKMRIDSSGNVGIGTSSPSYRLEVKGPSATAGQLSIHDGTGDTTVSGNNAASLLFQTRDTSVRTIAEIDAVNTTTNGTGGAMVFQTRISDTLAERMRIDASANLQFNSGYGSVAVAYGCRAWCQYNASRTIIGSANITSITVNGTGDSTLNFTTAMPDANYSAVATTNEDGGTAKFCNATQPSTANIRVVTYTLAGVTTNNTYNFVAVFR